MRKMTMWKRTAVFAGLAAMGMTGTLAWSPAGLAQEKKEETPATPFSWEFQYRAPWAGLGRGPMLGVMLAMDIDLDGIGVRVNDVRRDGPADKAGIEEGDIIVSIDGHALVEALDDEDEMHFDESASLPGQRLVVLVRDFEEGEEVEVVVERDGESLAFMVIPEEIEGWGALSGFSVRMREMGERIRDQHRSFEWNADWDPPRVVVAPTMPAVLDAYQGAAFGLVQGRVHGLDVVELNPGLGAYFGTDEGVLIADVDEDSGLGLLPGDVVVDVDGRIVEDGGELRRILRSYEPGEEIEFRIWRDGAETTVVGTIE